jgi:hypothetical protein
MLVALCALGLALLPRLAPAIETLTDQNSTALVDPNSQSGMFSWTVDGVQQMFQQWFWYRVGAAGPEHSIDTISAPAINRPAANDLTTTYGNGNFSIRVDYVLTGGAAGSGGADMGETLTINNLTTNSLDFHFFQYSDFDLNGSLSGDTVQLKKNGVGLYYEADQTKGATTLAETVTTPGANEGETAFYNSTLVKLNNAGPDTLNDNAGPTGPGDVTWALEWDTTIAAGGSFIISKDKAISTVPEPSALALVCLGLAGFVWQRRRN